MLHEALFLALLAMPFALLWGACCCITCTTCDISKPSSWDVTISGMPSGGTCDLTIFNGTFTLTPREATSWDVVPPGSTFCEWDYLGGYWCTVTGTDYNYAIRLISFGGFITCTVNQVNTANSVVVAIDDRWKKSFVSMSLSDEDCANVPASTSLPEDVFTLGTTCVVTPNP